MTPQSIQLNKIIELPPDQMRQFDTQAQALKYAAEHGKPFVWCWEKTSAPAYFVADEKVTA